jgi:hypothetical protein
VIRSEPGLAARQVIEFGLTCWEMGEPETEAPLTITPPVKRANQIILLLGALNTSPDTSILLAPPPPSTQSAGAFYLFPALGKVDGVF